MLNLLLVPLSIFVGVIFTKYIFPVLDVYLEDFTNQNIVKTVKTKLEVTKLENSMQISKAETKLELVLVEKEIEEVIGEGHLLHDPNLIGFKMNKHPEDDFDFDDDDFDGFDDEENLYNNKNIQKNIQMKRKIGF
jgi:hypothetical protein